MQHANIDLVPLLGKQTVPSYVWGLSLDCNFYLKGKMSCERECEWDAVSNYGKFAGNLKKPITKWASPPRLASGISKSDTSLLCPKIQRGRYINKSMAHQNQLPTMDSMPIKTSAQAGVKLTDPIHVDFQKRPLQWAAVVAMHCFLTNCQFTKVISSTVILW